MAELTVGDALLLLSKYPKDLRLLIDGYEHGYRDPEIHFKNVVEAKNKKDYTGDYFEHPTTIVTVGPVIQALVLTRHKEPKNTNVAGADAGV